MIVTREEALASVTFERLIDGVEMAPSDMAFARKALKKAYRTYKYDRILELEEEKRKKEEKTGKEVSPGDKEEEKKEEDVKVVVEDNAFSITVDSESVEDDEGDTYDC